MGSGQVHRAMLLNGLGHLSIDLLEGNLEISRDIRLSSVEQTAIVFIAHVSLPESSSLRQELFPELKIPVLFFLVELKVVLLCHIVHGKDAIGLIG